MVAWAESGLVLADEFRDGNVPAASRIRELVDAAAASLPARADGQPWQIGVRSDSAAYDWHVMAEEAGGFVREGAEAAFVPSRAGEKRDTPPYRHLAIRVRRRPGLLFGDGTAVKHFAVINDWDTAGPTLLTWQRGTAGTIEHVNYTLKDELAAGVHPAGQSGANAAWLRLQVLTHNLLELLKVTALAGEYRSTRPKRLRFAIFTHEASSKPHGRVVRHARGQVVRLVTRALEALVRPVIVPALRHGAARVDDNGGAG